MLRALDYAPEMTDVLLYSIMQIAKNPTKVNDHLGIKAKTWTVYLTLFLSPAFVLLTRL